MVIHSLNADYQVLYRKQETDSFEILNCKKWKEQSDVTYTLLHFFQKSDIRILLEKNLLCKELMGNFVDYKESFIWQEGLVMVFLRKEGTPLAKLLKRQEPLSQRLEIGKLLLERILLLNMPEYLLCSILNSDCILVTNDRKVELRYEPKTFLFSEKEIPEQLKQNFYQVFALLFQKEEQEQSSPDIHEYLESISQTPFQDVFRLYQNYDRMYGYMMGKRDVNQLKPNTWFFRLKKVGNQLLQIGKRSIAPVLVVTGMILLIYLICHPAEEEVEEHQLEQIGTLYIR